MYVALVGVGGRFGLRTSLILRTSDIFPCLRHTPGVGLVRVGCANNVLAFAYFLYSLLSCAMHLKCVWAGGWVGNNVFALLNAFDLLYCL